MALRTVLWGAGCLAARDVTVRCVFGGGNFRLPRHWLVAWAARGIGGVAPGPGEPFEHTADPDTADLRIHLRAIFAGVALKA